MDLKGNLVMILAGMREKDNAIIKLKSEVTVLENRIKSLKGELEEYAEIDLADIVGTKAENEMLKGVLNGLMHMLEKVEKKDVQGSGSDAENLETAGDVTAAEEARKRMDEEVLQKTSKPKRMDFVVDGMIVRMTEADIRAYESGTENSTVVPGDESYVETGNENEEPGDASERRCPRCTKVFSTKGNYQAHYRRKHLGERNYRCIRCHKSFSARSSLIGHLESKHDVPKEQARLIVPELKRGPKTE